jgi:predicted permease
MTVRANLRYSAKTLARTPALTITLLLTIALGIGSNAAVIGFVRGLVTRDVPLRGIETMVSVFARGAQDSFGPLSYEDYASVKARQDLFDTLGAARESKSSVVVDGRSSVLSVAALTPECASLFDLPVQDGVVVSHRVWQSEFDGRSELRGERIRIDGIEVGIVGIAPDWLDGLYSGNTVDIWMALDTTAPQHADRPKVFWTLGRLATGVSSEDAQAALSANRSGEEGITVLPYSGMTPEVAGGMRRIRTLLIAAASAVFFIACANVATFLLSRASARSRETSVRVALGASRGQLAAHVISDSILIASAGGALGLLLATWTTNIVPAFLFSEDAEHLIFVPDVFGIISAGLACAAITIGCGLLPLFEMRHDDPAAVLRRESAGPSTTMQRVRAGLVIAQMTACCLLVVSTSALLTGFRTALEIGPGQRLRNAILATVEARQRFDRTDLGSKYFRELEAAALTVAGVSAAAWAGMPPGSRPGWQPIRVEAANPPLKEVEMDVVAFVPRTLDDIIVPPVAGRMFGGVDTPSSCRVAVVNEAAASAVFDGNAVARVIQDPSGRRVEIVGVVAMNRERLDRGRPTIFYYAQQGELPVEREGPAQFRVPVTAPTRGVLETNVVSGSFFDMMGLSTVAGGSLPDEPGPERCRVGVVNQEAAELYFGGNAVGGAIIDNVGLRTEIVGVVHAPQARASQRRAEPAIYFPMAQDFVPRMTLIVAAREASDETVAFLRRRLEMVSGGRGSPFITTLEAHLSRIALAPERIATVLVGASAVTALALGVLGLYGAMAESARQRRREIAVRLALGAQGWRVIRQVFADGARLALFGAAVGTLGAFFVTRWLSQITPGARLPGVWEWLLAPLVLLAAVAIASVLPAREAVSADPLTIMHRE